MLSLSPNLRQTLLEEFRYVANEMRKTEDPARKLYFFSATYGSVNRIFNIEFDPELVFAHLVLNNAHQTIDTRISSISQRREGAIGIPDGLLEKLTQAVEELTDNWGKGKPIDGTLRNIALLTYATTGNGYYLYLKGQLSI